MTEQQISSALYREIQKAAENIYRYNRMERFSIRKILEAGRNGRPVDDIVIKTAKKALKNHPVKPGNETA